ncbi:MarR family winged helix-turn-helix transcriptional regulator [Dyella sedimenti]|uniref:MarR family winged helix-turn-helix transcriptional regulator n=1 Tax=Dyella sedimenti TaxID=2919947 RepID=UPI001FAA9F1D|nr:MarR family winged helix-turn-helix transcriptional regulator [Dyella sedimenti]
MHAKTTQRREALVVAEQLRAALRRVYRQIRRDAEESAVSPLQGQLLVAILEHPGIGVGELAGLERLRSPTISGHLKSLVEAGLVKRTVPDTGDRRRVGLMVTARGRATVEARRKQLTDRLAQALAELSPASFEAIRAAIPALNELDA